MPHAIIRSGSTVPKFPYPHRQKLLAPLGRPVDEVLVLEIRRTTQRRYPSYAAQRARKAEVNPTGKVPLHPTLVQR